MCGICGLANFKSPLDREFAVQRITAMVDALAHRGPDESGFEQSGSAMLGATRLAIRGVHDGKQPVADPQTGVLVVCNGEIDNHRELRRWLEERGRPVKQATDIAVLPGLYLELGEAFLDRLVGAFAIAVWDPRSGRLLLARDRAGERPLFFVQREDGVRFATELSAIAAHAQQPLTLSNPSLHHYLRFGIFTSPQTPFAEVEKVGPAELVTIDDAGVQRRRYWKWGITTTPKQPPSKDRFDEIFREAVRRQSDVDVEYAVFLSGGIDSSLVAAVLKSLRPERPLKAYTLRFSEESYDEGIFAERVARLLGLDPVAVWVKPDDFPQGIAELISMVGEPLADPAWIPTALLARRAAQDARLALVGEGGDELFGGYPTYFGAQYAERYARLPKPLKGLIRSVVDSWPPSDKKVTISFLLKRFVAGADMDGITRHRLWTSNLGPALLGRLGVSCPDAAPPPSAGELLDRVQLNDLETSLAEGLLTKADRASMSSAFELRAPFLDLAVMDYAATLPPEDRVRGLTTKVFLKRYALRYLPGEIVNRRKRGLSVPLNAWLRGPLQDWAESRLRSDALVEVGVRVPAALELLAEHRDRCADHARALWTLIVLSEWIEWARKARAAS
jgi:asparagine synthase (glutamine-hydrolysing)